MRYVVCERRGDQATQARPVGHSFRGREYPLRLKRLRTQPGADRRALSVIVWQPREEPPVRLTVQIAACLMRADLADRCCPWVPVVPMTWAGPGRISM
jgi:hypothetical protein